jgi:diguanylate cyclase (GGDEF)-like protein
MGKYGDLSDRERRKLYRDFTRAAREIQANAPAGGRAPSEGETEAERHRADGGEFWAVEAGRARRRPRYALRLRIESYAYSEGFAVSGLRPFLASLLSFLSPRRDIIANSFARALVRDNPYQAGPPGYSLARILQELKRGADALLKGSFFLRRESDRRYSSRGELAADLEAWEPTGHRVLALFARAEPRAVEALEHVQTRFEGQRGVDVLDLVEVVKAVYRLSLGIDGSIEAVRERLTAVAALLRDRCLRVYGGEERARSACVRIDRLVAELHACHARLLWFAHQLYPALLKMLNLFCRQEEMASILPQMLGFVGLSKEEIVTLRVPSVSQLSGPTAMEPGAQGSEGQQRVEAAEPPEEVPFDLNAQYHRILRILDYVFPGSRLHAIAEGDFSCLFWFHQRIFAHRDYRGPLVSRRLDFTDLLWKVSRGDPVAPVIVLHELIGQMLQSVNAEALGQLADPLRGTPVRVYESYAEVRRQWLTIREELLLRYLKELDFLEKEVSLRAHDARGLYLDSAAGRRSVEVINQIRNHLIHGYGHMALDMDRKGYFRCRPLHAVTQELCRLAHQIGLAPSQREGLGLEGGPGSGQPEPEGGQGAAAGAGEAPGQGPPEPRQPQSPGSGLAGRLQRNDLIELKPGPVLSQIMAYVEAVTTGKGSPEEAQAAENRVFLEILFDSAELLEFLLNDARSPLRAQGAEVSFAGPAERAARKEIDQDKTPLAVALRRDLERVDRLTGLANREECLRAMGQLFRQVEQGGGELTLLLVDLDHFRAINDTHGHEVADQVLVQAAEAVRACVREEDVAARFGADEILVAIKGDCEAGAGQAGRIRARYHERLPEELRSKLAEVPALMAQRQLSERRKREPLYHGGLEEFLERWKGRGVGSLSAGVAQGLGSALAEPCRDEAELFRRAERMLGLAKESGGGRAVIMVDRLQVPLCAEELEEYQRAGKPASFVELGLGADRPPRFWSYPYARYLGKPESEQPEQIDRSGEPGQ